MSDLRSMDGTQAKSRGSMATALLCLDDRRRNAPGIYLSSFSFF
jgi:hypothetical protein